MKDHHMTHHDTLSWTIPQLAELPIEHPIPTNTLKRHATKGTIPAYRDKRKQWRIANKDARDYVQRWIAEAQQFTGELSPYIATPEIRERWGVTPNRILHGRHHLAHIEQATLCDQVAWNRQQFYDIADQRGYLETHLQGEDLNPCLFSGCSRLAPQQPEGYGFRFCPTHLTNWKRVRNHPRQSEVSLASERRT